MSAQPLSIADELHVEAVSRVMRRICIWSQTLPESDQRVLGNALLNLAALRMCREVGAEQTAAMLWRLADCLADDARAPAPLAPVDLRRQNA